MDETTIAFSLSRNFSFQYNFRKKIYKSIFKKFEKNLGIGLRRLLDSVVPFPMTSIKDLELNRHFEQFMDVKSSAINNPRDIFFVTEVHKNSDFRNIETLFVIENHMMKITAVHRLISASMA